VLVANHSSVIKYTILFKFISRATKKWFQVTTKHSEIQEVDTVKNQQQQTVTEFFCVITMIAFWANPASSKIQSNKKHQNNTHTHTHTHTGTILLQNALNTNPVHNINRKYTVNQLLSSKHHYRNKCKQECPSWIFEVEILMVDKKVQRDDMFDSDGFCWN